MNHVVKTREKKRKEYYVVCIHCKRVITGFTRNDILYNLRKHLDFKHKDPVEGAVSDE